MPTVKLRNIAVDCATPEEAAQVAYHLEQLEQQGRLPNPGSPAQEDHRPPRRRAHETPRDRALGLLEYLQGAGAPVTSKVLAKQLGYSNGRVLSPILMSIADVFENTGGEAQVLRRKPQRIGSLYSAGPRIEEAIAKLRGETT